MPGIDANDPTVALTYDPNRLLDSLVCLLELETDVTLARALGVAPLVISEIRRGMFPVTAPLLMRMQKASRLRMTELHYLMGDRRKQCRITTHGFPRQT